MHSPELSTSNLHASQIEELQILLSEADNDKIEPKKS